MTFQRGDEIFNFTWRARTLVIDMMREVEK